MHAFLQVRFSNGFTRKTLTLDSTIQASRQRPTFAAALEGNLARLVLLKMSSIFWSVDAGPAETFALPKVF